MSETTYPRLFFLEYEEGHEVRVEFSKDNYSLDYDNGRDFLKKLLSATKSGKLTFNQTKNLIEDLDQRNNPPLFLDKDCIKLKDFHFLKGVTSQILHLIYAKDEKDFDAIPEKDPVEEGAFFEMCACCKQHGKIYTQAGMILDNLHSKSAALAALEELTEFGYVNAEEIANIKMQISESSLP